MRLKEITFFVFAAIISLLAASHRWGDSAHTMGLIKEDGGEAIHPAFLEAGKEHYTMIVTAKVIPPYSGDVCVVLEGEPKMDYTLFSAGPVVDVGMRDLPRFQDDTFFGLEPKHRLALWVRMTPSPSLSSHGISTPSKYTLAFYDVEKGNPVLTVPVIFRNDGAKDHASGKKH